jgi:PEP-CTERM motif
MSKTRGEARLWLSVCAALVLMVSQADAGSLTLVVTASDGNSALIAGGPLGTYTNNGNTLTITEVYALNTFLAANGSAVQFNGLQASSSFAPMSGSAVGAFVTQTGSVFYDTTIAGNGIVTVQAFQSGWLLPTLMTGLIQSDSTANFTFATAGSSQTFTSTYNGTLSTVPETSTSTGVAQNGYYLKAASTIPSFATPFMISNLMALDILPDANAQSTDGFSGSTTISAASVPEPASMMLMAMGMPLFLVFSAWLKRRRAAVA